MGWMLGIFYMTNAWDMPIYMLIVGLGLLFKLMQKDKWPVEMIAAVVVLMGVGSVSVLAGLALWRILATGSAIGNWIVIGIVVLLSSASMVGGQYINKLINYFKEWQPWWGSLGMFVGYMGILLGTILLTCWNFVRNFEQIAQGVDYVKVNSSWYQLLTLWGWDLFVGISLLGLIIYKYLRGKQTSIIDWLMVSWWLVGVFLIIIPELIYVKDIYISDYHRANTMFKLVYQSWVLFAFVGAYTVTKWWLTIKESRNKPLLWTPWVVICVLGIAVMAPYPKKAVESFYGPANKLFDETSSHNLLGTSWLNEKNKDEGEVLRWLEKLPGQPVILEAVGESYTEFNRFSAYTGLPTVEGWTVHEWLWRGGGPQTKNF